MYSGSFCLRDGSFRQSFWLQIFVSPDNKWIPFIKGDWTADTLKYMKPYIAEADLYMRGVLYARDAKFKRCRGGWDEMFKKMVKSGSGRVVVPDGAWDEKSLGVADVQSPVQDIAAGASGCQGARGNTDCVALSSATGCKLLNIDPALFLAMSAKKKQLRLSEVGEETPPNPATPLAASGRAKQWRTMVAVGTLSYFKAPDQRHSFVVSSRGGPKFTDGVANGKYRLNTDFRPLNACLQERTVKMETLKHLPALTQPKSVATSLDFNAFFYSFAVHPNYRKFVVTRALSVPHPATVGLNAANHPVDAAGNLAYVPSALYAYNALPMGPNTSPFFVIKITKFLLAWVRSFKPDTNCLAFTDDWLLIASPPDIYDLNAAFRLLVTNFGLVIAPDKGWTTPLDRFVFLGLGVCLHPRTFYVPQYKLQKLALRCSVTLKHSATHQQRVPARAVASLAGLATHLMLASPAKLFYPTYKTDRLTPERAYGVCHFLFVVWKDACQDPKGLWIRSARHVDWPSRVPWGPNLWGIRAPLTIDAMKMMPGHRWISRCSHALFAKQTTDQLSTAKRFLLKDSKAVAPLQQNGQSKVRRKPRNHQGFDRTGVDGITIAEYVWSTLDKTLCV